MVNNYVGCQTWSLESIRIYVLRVTIPQIQFVQRTYRIKNQSYRL